MYLEPLQWLLLLFPSDLIKAFMLPLRQPGAESLGMGVLLSCPPSESLGPLGVTSLWPGGFVRGICEEYDQIVVM